MVGKSIKKWWPVFLLPTAVAFAIGFVWPFIWGIYLSFCKFTTVNSLETLFAQDINNATPHEMWQKVFLLNRVAQIV